MALFKILKGNKSNLPTNKVDGYCYVTLDEHKLYVDYKKADNTLDRFALNAVTADKLGTDAGNINTPVYFEDGIPKAVSYNLSSMQSGIDNAIVGLSVSGTTVTYTRQNGDSGTITTQNTDTKVTQNAVTTSDRAYPIILGYNSSTSKVTNVVNKATSFTYNPSSKILNVPGTVVATTFSGALSGNAATATSAGTASTAGAFAAAKSITLSGDITGTSSSTGGWAISTTLASTGVSAGSYGLAAAATPAFGSSFNVPYVTVDSKGRITSAATYTVKLPANPNTDSKVTNTASSTAKFFITGTTNSSTSTGGQVFNPAVYVNGSTITATTFIGALSGTASKATADASGNVITTTYATKTELANLVDSAPETLNTLNELAAALGDDPNFATTIASTIGKKSKIGHTHTASYTPAGTVTAPSFTGSSATTNGPSGTVSVATSNHTHSVTAKGSVSASFSGTSATISTSYTPAGTITQPTFSGTAGTTTSLSGTSTVASSGHTHTLTAKGSVGASFSGTASTTTSITGTTTFSQITSVGALPTLTASVENHCLIFTFGQGTLPTASSVTVASSGHTHGYTPKGTVTATFTGSSATTASISGTTTVASSGHTHGYTPAGTVTAPTFNGTSATISTSYTPAGTITATFTGSSATSGAPSGSVAVGTSNHTHSVTAKGSVGAPTFSGTAATITTNGSTE